MATASGQSEMQVGQRNYRADQGFFLGISVALSILIVVGFGQLAVRGITVATELPIRVHLHALLLIGWLGLFSYQNWLAYKGDIALHRTLGKSAIVLVAAIIVANAYITVMTMADGRMAPQFTPGYFLALGAADTSFFTGLVVWALARRRDTQWHRRLMFGATLILAAAGINRVLRGMDEALLEPTSIAIQLAFLAVMAWNDKRVLGHVHNATLWLVPIVLVERFLPHLVGKFPPLAEFANSLMG